MIFTVAFIHHLVIVKIDYRVTASESFSTIILLENLTLVYAKFKLK